MLIENDYDARAKLAVEQITEHGLFDRIPESEARVICETIEFLRLHAGALEHQLNMLRDSKCGWRPIDECPKFGDLPVLVWDRGDLVEVLWDRVHKTDALCWCSFITDRSGTELWKMEPQPKYYLSVTPAPDA